MGGGGFAKVNLPLGAQAGHPLCQVGPSTGGCRCRRICNLDNEDFLLEDFQISSEDISESEE